MAKYSKGAQKGVKSAMKKMEKGTLRSGGSGKKVTNPKQAIAIGLSEAKKKGAKVPPVKKKAAVKKPAAKKAAPKKAAAKRSAAKKPLIKKKAAAKKAPVKKAAAKKAVAKKAPVKKAVAKKAVPKKAIAKPASPKGRKTAPVKAPPVPSLPPASELSEELVEKTANVNEMGREQMMVPGDGLNEAPVKTEDPVTAFDKHVFTKAMTKGDPHSKLYLSSKPRNSVKPSGKKPLWRK